MRCVAVLVHYVLRQRAVVNADSQRRLVLVADVYQFLEFLLGLFWIFREVAGVYSDFLYMLSRFFRCLRIEVYVGYEWGGVAFRP